MGSCREVDPSLFFHPEGERGPARGTRDAAAIAVCIPCPVFELCREYALAVREPYGVWGGLSEDDRVRIYRTERSGGNAVNEKVPTQLPKKEASSSRSSSSNGSKQTVLFRA